MLSTFFTLYLHGFGCTDPENCRVARYLQNFSMDPNNRKRYRLHTPCYHPNGDISKTDLLASISELRESITSLQRNAAAKNHRVQLVVVGYSVGGYLAAVLASRHPDLVQGLILLAPAIDNY